MPSTATGALHLAYFATEITLHRRIVQSLDAETSDAYLLFICRSAAKTRLISAMDFVNRLTPAHLQSFWYFASKINFTLIGTFGSLLWATAPGKEEADFYKTRLREYRWTLSVSATRARWLEYAVQMLDASREMLRGMKEKPPLADTIAAQQQHQQQSQQQHLVVSDSGVPSMKFGAGGMRPALPVQYYPGGSQHYGSEPSVSFEGFGGDEMGEDYEGSIGEGDFDERMSEGSDKGGLKTPVSGA